MSFETTFHVAAELMAIEDPLALIDELIADSENVRAKRILLPVWRCKCEAVVSRIFGPQSRQQGYFDKISYVSKAFRRPGEPPPDLLPVGLDQAIELLRSFKWEIERLGVAATASRIVGVQEVETLCNRFHSVCRQLRQRHDGRPTIDVSDEYDVQDLLHALLKIHFDDVRPEEWTPSYAGASARMDFLLKSERIVVECKKTRNGLTARKVGEELTIDIAKYKKHPNCQILVCFVYDPDGKIVNPSGLENDLSSENDGFTVKVIISPK